MPRMEAIGVRISWLAVRRKTVLASLVRAFAQRSSSASTLIPYAIASNSSRAADRGIISLESPAAIRSSRSNSAATRPESRTSGGLASLTRCAPATNARPGRRR